MTSTTDLAINRHVRRIMVKHWIDLGRMSIRTVRGVVVVYGRLQRIPGRDELIPPTVESIFYDIRRIKEVKWVRPHLDNWSNDAGLWQAREKPSWGSEG